jgi:hypothetical protein
MPRSRPAANILAELLATRLCAGINAAGDHDGIGDGLEWIAAGDPFDMLQRDRAVVAALITACGSPDLELDRRCGRRSPSVRRHIPVALGGPEHDAIARQEILQARIERTLAHHLEPRLAARPRPSAAPRRSVLPDCV